MLRALPWRKTTWVLLFWTAGIIAIWGIVELSLNPGVSQEDIQECLEEGFIPPEECEETLRELEDEDAVIGIPLLVIFWFAGLLLLGLVWFGTRQSPTRSD
jgi:hypothetical protein